VIDCKSGELLGRIIDLTTEGMLLLNDRAYEVGVSYEAKIALVDNLSGIVVKDVNVSFTTQWNKPDINPSNFVCGVKFTNLNADGMKMIEQVITKIGYSEEN
jgi:hypothetical protein